MRSARLGWRNTELMLREYRDMADYFTSDHFKLLNKWKGQKRDESNPEQNRAYEDVVVQ